MLSEEGKELLDSIRSNLEIPIFFWSPSDYDSDVVGPHEPGIFDAYLDRRRSAEEIAEAELSSMSDLQLFNLYNDYDSLKKFKRKHGLSDPPPWYAEGFGFRPVTNYDHWFKMEYWTTEEAVCLSIGFDPKAPDLPKIKGFFSPLKAEQFYRERHELAKRAFPHGDDEDDRIVPQVFIAWVAKQSLEVPAAFTSNSDIRIGGGSKNANKLLTPIEKASLLKLVAAMAIEQYSYNPKAQRNEAVQHISDDLDRLGISLDLKTIRKWLKDACEQIEPENLPK